MQLQPAPAVQLPQPDTEAKIGKSKWKLREWMNWGLYVISAFVFSCILFVIFLFFTDSGTKMRMMMADTLITTQHRHWAKYVIGEQALTKRVEEYKARFEEMASIRSTLVVQTDPMASTKPLTEVKAIEGHNWKGFLLFVHDPKKVRVVVPEKIGMGEKVTQMVARTGALYGVNGGGFVDPKGEGNGFHPTGIVMSKGRVFYHDSDPDHPIHVVGIDKEGKMVAGKYSLNEMQKLGVSEAVSFHPRFIVNGKGQIRSNAEGWGIAPRTCMAQTADGTIIFAIIDGRQKHSVGATLFEVQNILLEHGAVIAANLDGGASTMLVKGNKYKPEGYDMINTPASQYGERPIPTGFMVFDNPDKVEIKNVWQGIDMTKFDSLHWLW